MSLLARISLAGACLATPLIARIPGALLTGSRWAEPYLRGELVPWVLGSGALSGVSLLLFSSSTRSIHALAAPIAASLLSLSVGHAILDTDASVVGGIVSVVRITGVSVLVAALVWAMALRMQRSKVSSAGAPAASAINARRGAGALLYTLAVVGLWGCFEWNIERGRVAFETAVGAHPEQLLKPDSGMLWKPQIYYQRQDRLSVAGQICRASFRGHYHLFARAECERSELGDRIEGGCPHFEGRIHRHIDELAIEACE